MTDTQIIISAAVGLLIPPILIMLGRKAGCGINVKNVIVTCPNCRTDLKLKRLRNYKCPRCHEDMVFFDVKTGQPHKNAVFIKCGECGTSNLEGMKFCYKCKDELPVIRRKVTPPVNNNTEAEEIR